MQLNEYMIHMCIRLSSRVEFLRTAGFDNICVSRSRLQDYSLSETGSKTVFDNRKHPRVTGRSRSMEISFATLGGQEDKADGDLYLYVKSGMKQQKEKAISSKLTLRFVQEIKNIRASLSKQRGIKEEGAVNQRTGRLRERYPSVSKLYTIELKVDENKTVNDIIYERSKQDKEPGVYFIRCSQRWLTEELIWEIYGILRELECTFRCLKTDPDIRPIHHQKDKNTEAHIFTGIVACQIVHAIRRTMKQKDIHHSWKRIRDNMSSQTRVTTRIKRENNDILILRNATPPNQEQAKLYSALKFKQTNPNMRKKP